MPEPVTESEVLMPANVLLASSALGNVHNAEISAYLSAHPAATSGHIYTALQDCIDVVRGTPPRRLRDMEATGIITGDPAPENHGSRKVVCYSFDAHRLNWL